MKDENKQVLSLLERVQRVSRMAFAMLCLFVSFALAAQETVVKGTVVDDQGEPLIGATIMVAKTTNGTTADFDGNFSLKCKPGAKLVISYVGYQTQEVPAQDGMRVVLKESSEMLDAVEVVAYGVQKKVTVTGAISSVKGDDLARTPVSSVNNVLAGQLTGVTTVQYSGEPGSDAATIFVRGQGTWNNSAPLIQVDGVERTMGDIDPEEIESITVLKDASATAVFGVRGANGVVLITTKRGKEGKAKIDVSTSFSLVQPTKMVEQATSYEYGLFHNQMQYNDWVTGSQSEPFVPQFSEEVLNLFKTGSDPIRFPSVRWADYLMKENTLQTKSNVNISGGTKGVRYFVSLGLLTQGGMFEEFDYKENFGYSYNRFNYRTNLDLEVTKTSTITFNVAGIVSSDHKPYTGQDTSRLIAEMYRSTPFSSPGIVDDRMIYTTDLQYIDGLSLPFVGGSGMQYITGTSGTGGSRGTNTNKLQADLMWKQKLDFITQGLDFHIKGSYNSTFWARKDVTASRATYTPVLLESGELGYRKNSIDGIPSYKEETGKARDWYFEAAFNYNRTFGENTITALALYNQSKVYYPKTFSDIPSGYIGLVGRVTYDYASKYLVDVNIGYNGSENFHPDRRFGVFPAGSIGWVVSNEKFWEPIIPYMDFFKLRASWGVVGNDKVKDSMARFMYTSDPYVTGSSILAQYDRDVYGYNYGLNNSYVTPGYAESSKNNPDVSWEKAFKQDYGFDMQLFNSRLKLTFDYYKEHRTGILVQDQTAPNYIGFAVPWANLGVVDSHGWEISVNWNHRVNDDFSYWANVNLSNNWNKIVEMKEAPQANYFMYQAGHRIGSRSMYKFFEFYDPATTPANYEKKYGKPFPAQLIELNAGDACYVDLDGDGKITPNDKTRDLGYTDDPQFVAGLNLGASYKNFELSMQWTGAWGVSRIIGDVFRMPFYTTTSQTQGGLLSYHLTHSWNAENPGQDYDYPRPSWVAWDNNYAESTLYEKDSKYLRLKTLQIAYNLRAPWLKKVGMNSMQVALSGYNLLTFTNYLWGDPETRASSAPSYPLQRTYTVSLKLNF